MAQSAVLGIALQAAEHVELLIASQPNRERNEIMPETKAEIPQEKMLTSWATTRPELDAGWFINTFVRVNIFLYSRPPSKTSKAIGRASIRLNCYIYRKSHGKIFGRVGELDTLLLTTTGRKSGKARTTPVGFQYISGSFVVFAVPGHFDIPGGPKAVHPAWYLNLVANPQATIDIGPEQFPVNAKVLPSGAERDKMWQGFVDVYAFLDEFQKRAGRPIPIVMLTPAA
jgi:deazaflavin-dependent oxidoreductase (nitroreductase family)